MKKIEKIVELCNDCVHCLLLKSDLTNHNSAAICTNKNAKEPFLLMCSDLEKNVKSSYQLEIPANCPLEDYKS